MRSAYRLLYSGTLQGPWTPAEGRVPIAGTQSHVRETMKPANLKSKPAAGMGTFMSFGPSDALDAIQAGLAVGRRSAVGQDQVIADDLNRGWAGLEGVPTLAR